MTHLILKDIVKVKGQVSEMATLLIDPEEAIVGVAQNVFNELANKASGCSGTSVHRSGEGLVEAGSLTQKLSPAEGMLVVGSSCLSLCCLNEGR